MAIIDDLLGTVEGDADLRQCQVGPRSAAVWSRGLGLASLTAPAAGGVPAQVSNSARLTRSVCCARSACTPGETLRAGPANATSELLVSDRGMPAHRVPATGRWAPRLARSAGQLAPQARSDDPTLAAVGLAAINSLLRPDPDQLVAGNAYELILRHGEGKRVTVVGHFPFVEQLRRQVEQLWVLELEPHDGDLPAAQADAVIPGSDVVAITGSTLVNHTLDRLLALCSRQFVLLLGPTTPLSPVLFEHGVAALGGTLVDRPGEVLRQVAEGVSLRRLEGVRQVIWRRDRRDR